TVNIDRILEACIKKGASEVHLFAGSPPLLRLNGALSELKSRSLDSADCELLMKSITPDRNQRELEESGAPDFDFAFGDAKRFRASAYRKKGNISVALRTELETRKSKLKA